MSNNLKQEDFTAQYTYSDLDVGHEMILAAKSFRLTHKDRGFPTHHTVFVISSICSITKEIHLVAKDDLRNTLVITPQEVSAFHWRYAKNDVKNRPDEANVVIPLEKRYRISVEQHQKLLKLFNQYRLTVDMIIRYDASNSADSRDARDMSNDIATQFKDYLTTLKE